MLADSGSAQGNPGSDNIRKLPLKAKSSKIEDTGTCRFGDPLRLAKEEWGGDEKRVRRSGFWGMRIGTPNPLPEAS